MLFYAFSVLKVLSMLIFTVKFLSKFIRPPIGVTFVNTPLLSITKFSLDFRGKDIKLKVFSK